MRKRILRACSSAFAAITGILWLLACAPAQDPTDSGKGTEAPTSLVIQENSALATRDGFVSTTGLFKTDKAGFSGSGFISYLGTASNIVYSVRVEKAGSYALSFRYSFGGTETNLRDACIVVNGAKVQVDEDKFLEFPYTGDWAKWADTAGIAVPLIAGDNNIRIQPAAGRTRSVALTSGIAAGTTATGSVAGLPNIDYLKITGENPSAGSNSTLFYTLSAGVKDSIGGTIGLNPEQDFYLGGTLISLKAEAASGYAFESWTGTAPSTSADYSFAIGRDMSLAARFLPAGTVQPAGLVGFGSVQDDAATPYILTGGSGGAETTVASLVDLTSALTSADAKIVRVSGLITTIDNKSVSINVASNKTITSAPGLQGHLKNIELKLSGENYILRDLVISEVIAADALGGTGNDCVQLNGSRHVWIDRCEFYSSLGPSPIDVDGNGTINEEDAKDYYDGLLDIKNGASFITVSRSYFHDHWKAILVGSGDALSNKEIDGQIRLTMHGNYFRDVKSRSPLIRYGKAHVYNNYYLGDTDAIDSTVNARCGSEVKVEGNVFEKCNNTVGFFYDTSGFAAGTWNLVDNAFVSVAYGAPASTGSWSPAYAYAAAPSAGIKAAIPASAGVGKMGL